MQAYQWQCQACARSNSAAHDVCEGCGCAAAVRGDAVAAGSGDSVNAAPAYAGVPLWRKVLGASGLLVSGAGALWLKFSWTMQLMGTAWLMLLGGLLVAWLAASWNKALSPPP